MASKHEITKSEESAYSDASSTKGDGTLARIFLAAAELEMETDSFILQRSLSLRSVISTTSSFSQKFQSARFRPDLQKINQIGSGLQGAVFEVIGKSYAIKKENPGNEELLSNLLHEYKNHCDVWSAFDRYQSATRNIAHIPKPYDFISKSQVHTFWNEIFPKMPQAYQTRGNIVTMERILPLPKVVRKALLTYFRRQEQKISMIEIESFLSNPYNKHCLARVYLGLNEGFPNLNSPAPLRNFPLDLDSMRKLGIDTITLAKEMGGAYATLHWGAGINGDDVEFVFGTSALEDPRALANSLDLPWQHRAVGLYLLDFGQCDTIDLSQSCNVVYQAFKGAMVTGDNQLFIPHPSSSELFAAFKKGYIDAGNLIISDKQLGNKFSIEEFIQEYEEYAEDFIY